MGIPLGDRRVGVAQDLLALIQRAAAVHQEGSVLVPQIVDSQLRQSGFIAQPCPDLVDSCVRLA